MEPDFRSQLSTVNSSSRSPLPAPSSLLQPPCSPLPAPCSSPSWYCLRTQQKREHIAAAHVRLLPGVEVYSPRLRFERMTRRGRVWFREALFPGYIFARFDPDTHQKQVTSAQGVSGIVRFGLLPTVVPDGAIDEIRLFIGDGEHEITPSEISPGDEVVVTHGLFKGLKTIVTQVVPAKDRIKVLLEFLGDSREIEILKNEVLVENRHILAA
ncbi:MAG TPA: transcription termination/antitermination NusG family protein [Chthoniobacteraceae bacterium]|nr:transcription termination/antitermination NusG family protein [Chthoniobacteraceae bacterium]